MEPEQEVPDTAFFKSWLAADVNQLNGGSGNLVKNTTVHKIAIDLVNSLFLWVLQLFFITFRYHKSYASAI